MQTKTVGKIKGQFIVTESKGSKTRGQVPSMRVRLVDSLLCVAVVKSSHNNLVSWMRNNPSSEERKALDAALFSQGYTMKDVQEILSKSV